MCDMGPMETLYSRLHGVLSGDPLGGSCHLDINEKGLERIMESLHRDLLPLGSNELK